MIRRKRDSSTLKCTERSRSFQGQLATGTPRVSLPSKIGHAPTLVVPIVCACVSGNKLTTTRKTKKASALQQLKDKRRFP